jgi:hypothetical protein
MSDSYIISSGQNCADSLTSLTKMLERDGLTVTSISSTPGGTDGVRWRATCVDPFGNTMFVDGRGAPTKCVKHGMEITHTKGQTWDALPLAAKPVKKRVRLEEPEPDFNTIAFAWPASTAGVRVTDSLNYLRIWGIMTPEEQIVCLNRLAAHSKGGA